MIFLFSHLKRLYFKSWRVPSSSFGQSSQGSPHPSPGILLQQHFAFVVLKAFGTEHFPFSKLVKQKLWRVSKKENTVTFPATWLDDDCLALKRIMLGPYFSYYFESTVQSS